jgi:hypothetical protein
VQGGPVPGPRDSVSWRRVLPNRLELKMIIEPVAVMERLRRSSPGGVGHRFDPPVLGFTYLKKKIEDLKRHGNAGGGGLQRSMFIKGQK